MVNPKTKTKTTAKGGFNKLLKLLLEFRTQKIEIVYVDEVPFIYENFVIKVLGEALRFVGEGIVNNAQVFGYSIYTRIGCQLDKLRHWQH